jgi:hypothetical protein
MNNREIIYKYKNMIKSGYWGIVSRIQDLISELQEKSSKYLHIGDNLQKKNFIHNNISYVIIYNKNYNDINLYLLTIENSFQFGIILFQKQNKDIAIIQDLFAFDGPNFSQIEVMADSILITNLMILICKKMNIKKNTLNQACQTQTTLRATNATKTDKRAAKVLKKSLSGPNLTKYND